MPSVLVVDDSPIDRVLIEGILKKDPRMKVRQAASGANALAAIGDEPPDIVRHRPANAGDGRPAARDRDPDSLSRACRSC